MCGEQCYMTRQTCPHFGSPPRVRGTEYGVWDWLDLPGITPACAGNSQPRAIEAAVGRDHPRVCGEQQKVMQLRTWLIGSPPRVRGTVDGLGDTSVTDIIGGVGALLTTIAAFSLHSLSTPSLFVAFTRHKMEPAGRVFAGTR